jgi:hypothetical protein
MAREHVSAKVWLRGNLYLPFPAHNVCFCRYRDDGALQGSVTGMYTSPPCESLLTISVLPNVHATSSGREEARCVDRKRRRGILERYVDDHREKEGVAEKLASNSFHSREQNQSTFFLTPNAII